MYTVEFQTKRVYQELIHESYLGETVFMNIVSTYPWYVVHLLNKIIQKSKNEAKC